MHRSTSPTGDTVLVPENASEDVPAYQPHQREQIVRAFESEGFALVRGLVPADLCMNVRAAFEREVRPFRGVLPRINGRDETSVFNEHGFLVNSLMNIQRKSVDAVPEYSKAVLAALTHDQLAAICRRFFGRDVGGPGLMTWNHIVANPVTKPHTDSHFWARDARIAEIVGAWVALEDIHAGAGRLYVYPRSHLKDMEPELARWQGLNGKLGGLTDSAYESVVVDLIRREQWSCVAPSLKMGDVLLWDSRTIHGSLPTDTPSRSRSSFTAHFSACRGRFIKFRASRTRVNGIAVTFAKRGLLGTVRQVILGVP